MMDGFTTSDIVSRTRGTTGSARERVNYMRNSVKVVVDAYDGTVDVLRVRHGRSDHRRRTARCFPTLFKDASAMPPDLRQPRALSRAAAASCRPPSTACTT